MCTNWSKYNHCHKPSYFLLSEYEPGHGVYLVNLGWIANKLGQVNCFMIQHGGKDLRSTMLQDLQIQK